MSPARTRAPVDSVSEIATVRIDLRHTDPPIWRQVEVPTSITLRGLHDVIQIVMEWLDYHLWEFTIAKRRYGLPMDEDWGAEPRVDASAVRLRDVLAPRKTVIDYVYDFGDHWECRIVVTKVRAGEPGVAYPRYVGGERNAPPEDCGGIPWSGSDRTTPRRSTRGRSATSSLASPLPASARCAARSRKRELRSERLPIRGSGPAAQR